MAENDGASKTEEPTGHRLAEARKQGDVAKSQDLVSFASLAGAFSVLAVGGDYLSRHLMANLTPFLSQAGQIPLDGGGALRVGRAAAQAAAPALIAVLAGATICGVAGNLIQHGLLLTPGKLAPDLKRLSPLGGFQRMFGLDSLVNFIKSLLKLVLMIAVAWWALAPSATQVVGLTSMDPVGLMGFSGGLLKRLFMAALALFLLIGGLDWIWQRRRFMSKMRMSKEEVKEEFRQSEGDPHVKAKQKQIRFERAKRRMMAAVPKATVVVMNPTHYAVALKYDEENPTPVCVAKGLDSLALRIREVAEEANVPVIEDPPLARALYASVEIDDTIPRQHYEAVAKVIGFVLAQAKRREARGGRL